MEPEDSSSGKEMEPGSKTQDDLDLKEFGRLFPSVPMDPEIKAAMEAVDACSLCVDLEISYSFSCPYKAVSGIARRYALSSLHRPCKTAACRSILSASNSVFCDRCQHLRIYHFVSCRSLQEERSVLPAELSDISICIRNIEDVEIRSANCSLCRLLLDRKRCGLNPAGKRKPILRFFPEFRKLNFGLDEPTWRGLHTGKNDTNILQAGTLTESFTIVRRDDKNKQHSVGYYWEQPNWDIIKGWLVKCLMQNPHPGLSRLSHLQEFRLIDVKAACVVAASDEERRYEYAALSYVWGERSKEEFELRENNITTLEKAKSLDTPEVPLTIKDAMTVCKKLEIPYLWVDRLCIVQDNNTNKHNNVNNMDAIFMASVVTFVALAGLDARHGLPGVSTRPRRSPLLLTAAGMEFWRNHGSSDERGSSRWVTRGWTYQEEKLSPRLLYFTDEQTIAESNLQGEDNFTERIMFKSIQESKYLGPGQLKALPRGSGLDVGQSKLILNTWKLSIPNYLVALRTFSRRNLTYEIDRVRAISGVLHALYGEGHLFGLPFEHFDFAMLWEFDAQPYSTIPYSPIDQGGDGSNPFPSWSWASIPQEYSHVSICKDSYLTSSSFRGAVASWAFVSKEGRLQPILATGDPIVAQKLRVSLFSSTLAWTARCMPTRNGCPRPCYLGAGFNNDVGLPWDTVLKGTWIHPGSNNRRKNGILWSSYKDFWLDSRGCLPSQPTKSDGEQSQILDISPEYLSKFTQEHIYLASSTTKEPGHRLLCYTQLLSLTVTPLKDATVLPDQRFGKPKAPPAEDIYLLNHPSSTRPIGLMQLTKRTYETLLQQHSQKYESTEAQPLATFLALSVGESGRKVAENRFGLQLDEIGVVDIDMGSREPGVGWGPADDGRWWGQSSTLNQVSSDAEVKQWLYDERFIVLNVMMVVDGPQDGVVRRGGIGMVMLKRWVMADAEWGVVVLE